MMPVRMLLAMGLATLAGMSAAAAQSFPSKSIQLVVPFAAGGSADAIARTLANELSGRLGQPIVVENKGGAGGVLGLQQVAKSPADGHTLGIGAAGAMTIGPQFPDAPPFDGLKDLAPVARLVDVPLVIVANPASGLKSIADVIARAKSLPEGLSYGSTGPRSGQHLAVEFLRHQSGAKLVHVPYRGSAPASADVLGGQIPLASIDLTSVQALIQAGRLTPLAVTTARRTELAPDIPTLIEQGIQFSSAAWLGLFAPAGTREPVIAAISGHVREVLLKPEMKKQVNTHALDVAYEDAASFKAALAKEFAEWTGIVKVLGDVK